MMISTVEPAIKRLRPGICWVIVDPRLSDDTSLDVLRGALAGCTALDSVWRRTSEAATGSQLAAAAVADGAGRVVVVGDETTIRGAASILSGTGIPLGLLPIGSGRGLARSLGAATDPYDAIAAATGESTSVLDLMKVTIDGARHLSSFTTVGIDEGGAVTPWPMPQTGTAGSRPRPALRSSFGATATVDQRRPTYSRSAACMISIGGRVVSGERPTADERTLHLSMLRPSPRFGLKPTRMRVGQAGRRVATTDSGTTGQRMLLVLNEAKPYYLDGALAGHATTVSAELQPDALTLLVPA